MLERSLRNLLPTFIVSRGWIQITSSDGSCSISTSGSTFPRIQQFSSRTGSYRTEKDWLPVSLSCTFLLMLTQNAIMLMWLCADAKCWPGFEPVSSCPFSFIKQLHLWRLGVWRSATPWTPQTIWNIIPMWKIHCVLNDILESFACHVVLKMNFDVVYHRPCAPSRNDKDNFPHHCFPSF